MFNSESQNYFLKGLISNLHSTVNMYAVNEELRSPLKKLSALTSLFFSSSVGPITSICGQL